MRPLAVAKQQNGNPLDGKLSPQFSARLVRMKPSERVRAIALLRTSRPQPARQRQTREEKQNTIALTRASATAALEEIDRILARFKGRRLSDSTALGTVAVEATSAGILALARSEHVAAISEDQPISLAR